MSNFSYTAQRRIKECMERAARIATMASKKAKGGAGRW